MQTRAQQVRDFNSKTNQLEVWLLTQTQWYWKGGEWWRTPEQAALYAQRGIGIKDSKHIYSLAKDYVQTDVAGLKLINDGGFYQALGSKAKELGLRWGGDFSGKNGPAADLGHVEYPEQPAR